MAKQSPTPPPLDPTRVPVDGLAELLATYNKAATAKAVRADLAAGAPAHEDGTIDVLAHAAGLPRAPEAWLNPPPTRAPGAPRTGARAAEGAGLQGRRLPLDGRRGTPPRGGRPTGAP